MEAQFHDIYKYIYKCTVCTGTYLTAYQRHLILREFQVPTVCQYQSRLATSRLRNARRDKESKGRSPETRATKSRVDLFRLRNIEFNLHTVGAKKLGVT